MRTSRDEQRARNCGRDRFRPMRLGQLEEKAVDEKGRCTVRRSSKAELRRAFKHLEDELPRPVTRQMRNLRHPDAHWIRVPVGILLIFGGVFAVLPGLGLWMLPLGLLLIAYDLPFLRRPIARFTIGTTRRWVVLKNAVQRRWGGD